MTPAERAIEIAAVGLGQAGGNLAAEFYRRGYRALALNTATTDLSSLTHGAAPLPEDLRVYIGLEGYDGAGGDIAYGRQCISTHSGKIRDRVSEHVGDADVVVVAAGLGGGTGSAVSELIRVLSDLSLPTVVLATLPSAHESGIVKVNAMRALDELVKQDILGWCFADNSCLAKHHGSVSFDRYYAEINRVIVDPIDAFNRLNNRPEFSAIRSLDGEDYRTLLLSRGIVSFATAMLPRLSGESVVEALRDGLLHSNFQPDGFRLENISYLALVIEASESTLAETPFSFIEEIHDQLKQQTGGAAIYMGVYRTASSKPLATLRVFASSPALPDGIQELIGQAKREGGQLQDKLQRELGSLELGEVAEYQLFRTHPGNARRRMAADNAPIQLASRMPNRSPSTKLSAWKASRASALPREAASSIAGLVTESTELPDRDAYDQLVREFKEAETEEIKRRVSQKLEMDQRSDNSLVRYYAVRTMTKIDPQAFVGSLKAATRDEDATVRALAIKALNRS